MRHSDIDDSAKYFVQSSEPRRPIVEFIYVARPMLGMPIQAADRTLSGFSSEVVPFSGSGARIRDR